jgi:hypothetical protein
MPLTNTELLDKLVAIAKKELGTRESGGNNKGQRIEVYQQSTWLAPSPWPWCAAFTCWVLREWLNNPDVRSALKLTDTASVERWRCLDASAFGWEKWAKGKKLQVLAENQLARRGDFVVFDFSHIGIVVADQKKLSDAIETIEGNTNNKGQRDSTSGDGVWEKKRTSSLTKSYIRILA